VGEETLSKEQTVNFPNIIDDGASLGQSVEYNDSDLDLMGT